MCHFQVVETGLTVLSSSLSRCMFILPSSIILPFFFFIYIYLWGGERKEGVVFPNYFLGVHITLFKKEDEDEDDELLWLLYELDPTWCVIPFTFHIWVYSKL